MVELKQDLRVQRLIDQIDEDCANLADARLDKIGSIISRCKVIIHISSKENFKILRAIIIDKKNDTRLYASYLVFLLGLTEPLIEPGIAVPFLKPEICPPVPFP